MNPLKTLIISTLLILIGASAMAKTHSKKPEGPKSGIATFAGGCFWCMTPPFEKLDGVLKVTAGYTDGKGDSPTYEDYGDKGYTEGVQITYNPMKITYSQLVDVFWKQINPTDPEGQFVDRGPHYRAGIFFHNEEQRKMAEKSKAELDKSGRYDKPIVIKIKKYVSFFPAEDYHQDYYKKNTIHYNLYHSASGRDQYLDKIWGKGKH